MSAPIAVRTVIAGTVIEVKLTEHPDRSWGWSVMRGTPGGVNELPSYEYLRSGMALSRWNAVTSALEVLRTQIVRELERT